MCAQTMKGSSNGTNSCMIVYSYYVNVQRFVSYISLPKIHIPNDLTLIILDNNY